MEPSRGYTQRQAIELEEILRRQEYPESNEGTPRMREVTSRYDFGSHIVEKDPANRMWSEYLGHVKEYDTVLAETWKEDADGDLTFVSHDLLV